MGGGGLLLAVSRSRGRDPWSWCLWTAFCFLFLFLFFFFAFASFCLRRDEGAAGRRRAGGGPVAFRHAFLKALELVTLVGDLSTELLHHVQHLGQDCIIRGRRPRSAPTAAARIRVRPHTSKVKIFSCRLRGSSFHNVAPRGRCSP